uniref:MULE transposase domain-containing protein n=1 Tax=Meloidogyne incognita TaxID=6306 RepID=A0A914LVB2_MELIC
MCDFEQSEISAVRQVFPHATITRCVFHLGNALYKHIQALPGLSARYRNNNNDKNLLRSLQALAFVPINEELLKYFVLTYIGPSYVVAHPEILPGDDEEATYGDGCDGWLRAWINHEQIAHRDALFPIQLWNLSERLHIGLSRTNN